jgi:predicted small integral membrane protein
MNDTAIVVSRNRGFFRALRDDWVSYSGYYDYILPQAMGGMFSFMGCQALLEGIER